MHSIICIEPLHFKDHLVFQESWGLGILVGAEKASCKYFGILSLLATSYFASGGPHAVKDAGPGQVIGKGFWGLEFRV